MASKSGNLQELLAAGQVEYEVAHAVRPAGITVDLDGGGTLQVIGDEQSVVAFDLGELIKLAGSIIEVVGEIMDDWDGEEPEGDGDGSGGGSGSGSGGGGGKTVIINGGNNTIIIQ